MKIVELEKESNFIEHGQKRCELLYYCVERKRNDECETSARIQNVYRNSCVQNMRQWECIVHFWGLC